MRRVLRWMAANRWLKARLPRLPFVRRAVLRFMPGEDAASALDAAERFRADGITALLTQLGENVGRPSEADRVCRHYLDVLEDVAARGLDAELSVKLTQLGFDFDPRATLAYAERLAVKAAGLGGMLWIDMEGSAYTEGTVELYERLKARHANVGICLQAYLRRTAADLQRLLPIQPAIRLVKGAYAEPPTLAFPDRRAIDANFLALSISLLEARRRGPLRIGLGTHDVSLIEQVAVHAQAMGLGRRVFEVEMLYGIRADEQRRLAREGYVVRTLIAYGSAWYAWYLRRLAERPANLLFALRQIAG